MRDDRHLFDPALSAPDSDGGADFALSPARQRAVRRAAPPDPWCRVLLVLLIGLGAVLWGIAQLAGFWGLL